MTLCVKRAGSGPGSIRSSTRSRPGCTGRLQTRPCRPCGPRVRRPSRPPGRSPGPRPEAGPPVSAPRRSIGTCPAPWAPWRGVASPSRWSHPSSPRRCGSAPSRRSNPRFHPGRGPHHLPCGTPIQPPGGAPPFDACGARPPQRRAPVAPVPRRSRCTPRSRRPRRARRFEPRSPARCDIRPGRRPRAQSRTRKGGASPFRQRRTRHFRYGGRTSAESRGWHHRWQPRCSALRGLAGAGSIPDERSDGWVASG